MRPGFMGDVVGAKSFIGSHGLLRRSWIAPDRRKAEYGTQLTAKALRSIHSASARVGSAKAAKPKGLAFAPGCMTDLGSPSRESRRTRQSDFSAPSLPREARRAPRQRSRGSFGERM